MLFLSAQNIIDNLEESIDFNLSTTVIPLTLGEGLKILLLSTIAGLIIRYIFYKYSDTLSSKKGFGNSILMITVCVASLIAVVKSSLALSLGLVGALSVVRFRTAVKEPYNLSFLLLAICIGIAMGASQFTFAFLIIIIGSCIAISLKIFPKNFNHLRGIDSLDTVSLELPSKTNLNDIYEIFEKETEKYIIKSISEDSGKIFLNISISLIDKFSIERLRIKTREISNDCIFTFYSSPN